jgi:hypothetical protein
MTRPRVADRGDGLHIWRVAANILTKQSQTAGSEWLSGLGVGHGANNPHRNKSSSLQNISHSLGIGGISLYDLSTGSTWNVTSL